MRKIYLIVLIIIGAVVIGGTAYSVLKPKPSPYEFILATKQNITQEVAVTGKVKPAEDVDIAFEKGGRVAQVKFKVGDTVKKGNILVELENSDVKAGLSQAQAGLQQARASLEQYQAAQEAQQAKLNELRAGVRPEELQLAQIAVNNSQKTLVNTQTKAQTDLANLYDDVKDILNDAYTKADDAINKQTSELYSNTNSANPKLTFSLSNNQAQAEAESQRAQVRATLATFKLEINALNTADYSQLDTGLIKTQQYLDTVNLFLSKTIEALNYSTSLSQSAVFTYQGYVNTGRANINTALSAITAQKQLIVAQKNTNQQNLTTAQNNLETAQQELILKQAGATPEQIAGQEAAVRQAVANVLSQQAQIKQQQANVENAMAQLNKTTLLSPLEGIVTKMDAKQGEIASAQAPVVSIISQAKFQIEANIPEADIAKVKIGNQAKVTLDAYGAGAPFTADIIKIDPAATILEGVPTYKTTLQFSEENDKIKSGMTANLDILTAQRENVLAVPYRAVSDKAGEKFVKILINNLAEERKVTIGLRGSDGNIEIVSGLSEGEKVITLTNK